MENTLIYSCCHMHSQSSQGRMYSGLSPMQSCSCKSKPWTADSGELALPSITSLIPGSFCQDKWQYIPAHSCSDSKLVSSEPWLLANSAGYVDQQKGICKQLLKCPINTNNMINESLQFRGGKEAENIPLYLPYLVNFRSQRNASFCLYPSIPSL